MLKKFILLCLLSTFFISFGAAQAKADVVGIDVSRWQGAIDWNSVITQAGFAIIKAGGSDDGFYMDSQFERNRSEARRLALSRGFYYYAGGGDPVTEAEHFVSIVAPLDPGDVLVLDFEISHPDPVGYSWTFLERTEELLGVKPLLYTNMNRVWTHNWQPVVDNGNKLWGAIYDQDPAISPSPGAWPQMFIKQYSSSGRIAGVGTDVDMNVLRGTLEDFWALGQPHPAEPLSEPVTEVVPAVIVAPPVQLQDIVSGSGTVDEPVNPAADLLDPSIPRQLLLVHLFDQEPDAEVASVLDFGPRSPAEAVGSVLYSVVGSYLFGGGPEEEGEAPAGQPVETAPADDEQPEDAADEQPLADPVTQAGESSASGDAPAAASGKSEKIRSGDDDRDGQSSEAGSDGHKGKTSARSEDDSSDESHERFLDSFGFAKN